MPAQSSPQPVSQIASAISTMLDSTARAQFSRRPSPPPAALTAASSPLIEPPSFPGEKILTPEALRARSQGWQKKILEYATKVPEVAGAAALVKSSASRVKLVASGGNATQRAALQARLDAFDLGRATRLIWLSGECYIAWPDGDIEPYSLSVTELTTTSSPPQVQGATKRRDMTDPYFRVWNPADTNRYHAYSPNQAAIDLIDAMYLHQLADTAVATSRLAGAGIMVWPTTKKRMGLVDGKPQPDSQEEMVAGFTQAASKAISDRNSMSATIPYIVFTDANVDNYKPEMLRIERDDYADQYKVRFEEYRLRYATAIELPIESTTGMGSTNHWSAWAIREDKWREYLAPMIELVVSALQKRVVNKLYQGLTIEVDATELIAKPDQTATILRLLQLGVIDPAYAFLQLGLDPAKSQAAPQRAYATQQMDGIPSDFTLGGERGGGQYRG